MPPKILTYTEPKKVQGCINCKGKITNKNYRCMSCRAFFCINCKRLDHCKTCKGEITRLRKEKQAYENSLYGDPCREY